MLNLVTYCDWISIFEGTLCLAVDLIIINTKKRHVQRDRNKCSNFDKFPTLLCST